MGIRNELSVLALVMMTVALGGCPRSPYHCPPGYTPVCQSGSIYGTRCVCEPPRRYNDPP